MKKSILLSLVIFTLASCGTQVSENSQNLEETPLTPSSSTSFLDLIADKFIENDSFQQCMAQSADMCIDQVRAEVNVSTGNLLEFSCNDYLLEENKVNCLQQETLTQALESKDVSLCEKLEDRWSQDRCKAELIIREVDKDTDISVCDQLAEVSQQNCKTRVIIQQAVMAKNASLCDSIAEIANSSSSGAEVFLWTVEMDVDNCKMEVEMNIEIEQTEAELNASI